MINKLWVIIGGGGLGHKLPFLQGTFGTIEGVLIYIAVLLIMPSYINICLWVLIILFTVLSIILGTYAEKYYNTKDPHPFVLDEIAGFFCSVIFLHSMYFYLLLSFILFRLFDIWKPFPIRKLQDLPGGTGIVADDLLAGCYANICCQVIRYLM